MTTVGLSVTTVGDMSLPWERCSYCGFGGDETNIGKKDVLHHISSFMVCDVIKNPWEQKYMIIGLSRIRKVSITN